MSQQRHSRISELFLAARGLEPGARAAFLQTACAHDPGLLEEVASLLAADEERGSFLAGPALGATLDWGRLVAPDTGDAQPGPSDPRPAPAELGGFRILRTLGEGGMGVVYLAQQEQPQRLVALKVIRPERISAGALRRFEREAEVLGRLQHAGIAQIFAAGVIDTPGGQVPYFAMEYVRGRPLLEHVRTARADARERLRLLACICQAVHHAHQKGVIHRDLKPANILVDESGAPKVLDFGVARVTTSDLRATLTITSTHEIVGTLPYMSPEQVAGDGAGIDERSDVYALGVVGYELLSGRLPHDIGGQGLAEGARRICEEEPLSLSALDPRLRGDVETILGKALQKEPGRRYGTAAELEADLVRHLADEPIRARPPSTLYRASKFARRNRALVAGSATTALSLVAGLIVALAYAARLDKARSDEARLRTDAQAETEKVLRLSDARRLAQLEREAAELWPPHPERIPLLEQWLANARGLCASQPDHNTELELLRAQALPWSDEARRSDRESHPRSQERVAVELELRDLEQRLTGVASEQEGELMRAGIEKLTAHLADLEAELGARRTWRFPTPELAWRHDLLADLIRGLAALESGLLAESAVGLPYGWSVPRRLAFARELARGFGPGGEHALRWEACLAALAAEGSRLQLRPQMGLVPLGKDPDSGLWELAHLMSGEPPSRDESGRLVLTEASGIVLVLLPAGAFDMGAQRTDPNGTNFDPLAKADEIPVHRVRLDAFLIAKHEMTQGQWMRLTGDNPGYYARTNWPQTLLHPVEQVSWEDCMTWLHRAGLTLPTEAEWEYAARGGTSTPWWTGTERESLRTRNAVNIADRATARAGSTWPDIQDWPELDDGFAAHAPVGTFAPNPFGLHEVAGNVWELVMDGFAPYRPEEVTNPLAPYATAQRVGIRGGGFAHAAGYSRSASRANSELNTRTAYLGVRPARGLEE